MLRVLYTAFLCLGLCGCFITNPQQAPAQPEPVLVQAEEGLDVQKPVQVRLNFKDKEPRNGMGWPATIAIALSFLSIPFFTIKRIG